MTGYERHWQARYIDEQGRTQRRKIIAAVEETADDIRQHARRWQHR
jgi:hypothetical protein